ncbi:hypothetical protein A7K91_09535 [Paenibacillus oryzae]|uniref:Uncharacterized protein n=1 Tax=Paenibacillus oryzae TaxID=1844972 RepID=A0A1A5YBH4_9BACL|nr:hypothetical protein [Paenibacillus oryzae]OBR62949.1 hypothetical protein A7K91_09535 [Paenibacillus oryzae]
MAERQWVKGKRDSALGIKQDRALAGQRETMGGKAQKMGRGKAVFYLVIATGMLLYGMSAMEPGDAAHRGQSLFWLVWLAFAALIIAGNANAILMSNEKKRRLAQLKAYKARQRERTVEKLLMRKDKA